jgi:hypothetical protein
MVPATMGGFITALNAKGVSLVEKLVAPLGLFERGQFPALMMGWVEATANSGRGQAFQARVCYEELQQRFKDPEVRKTLGEGHFKSMYGGLLFGYSVVCTYSAKSQALQLAQEMEGLGVRTWAMSADQVRTLHHAFRGEIEDVRRCRARVELYAVQGNATWQSELFLPAVLLNADVLTGDTIAARRTWEQLARRAEEITSLKAYAGAANAAYLALRGELPAAIKAYEEVLPEFPLCRRVMWLAMRGYFAQALNAAGEHMRAKQLLSEAIARLDPADDVLVLSLESRRQLALAEAGLGNHAEAVRMLDGLLQQHADHDNPLLIGLLHKARAEVALMMSDKAGFEANFAAMEQRFRATKNPALIGQWERLAEAAVRAGGRPAATLRGERRDASWMNNTLGQRSVAELTAAPDRAEYALWLLLEQARAKAGYLYLWENNSWRLAAASSPAEPPKGLETQLRQRCEISQVESQADAENGTVVEIPTSASISGSASGSISTTTGNLSVNTGATAAPLLELNMPLPRSLEAEDAFATVIAGPVGVSLPAQAAAGTSQPAEQAEQGDKTVFIDSAPAPGPDESAYRVVVLSTTRGGQRTTVGGVILEVAPYDLFRLRPELLDTVAAALYERCVTSMTQTRA